MIWRLAADATVALHAAFVLFVVLGGLLVWRWPRLAWLHLPAAAWGFAVEVFGWICPLTDLENVLRLRAGRAGYDGGFIEHYLIPILYPAGLTREIQWLLAALVVLINGAVYGGRALALRRRRPSERGPEPEEG
ncbi:MAG: DUF2784 domain-containing protein [Acidobacteriota bacterium]